MMHIQGLATIPNASAWPSKMQCHALTGYPVDTPIVLGGFPAMDQQGVFEARTSRDNSVTGGTTMQQVRLEQLDTFGRTFHTLTYFLLS